MTTNIYDAADRKTLRVNPLGQRTTYAFDDAGREIQRLYADDSRVTTTYDSVGNRLVVADPTGRYTRTYDPLNLTTSVTNPDGNRLSFIYDVLQQRKVLVDANGGRTTTIYDAARRIRTLTDPQDGVTTYSYDKADRKIHAILANGTETAHVYNSAGQLTLVDQIKSDTSPIQTFNYTLDKVGNRVGKVDLDLNRVTWTLDGSYQLIAEHQTGTANFQTTYTYDPTGNRLAEETDGAVTTSTYNGANQLLYTENSLGERTSYTYDSAGNQIRKEEPNGDLTTNTWSVENQIVQVELPLGIIVTNTYNSDHLRTHREEDLDATGYIWDRNNLLHETDAFGAPQLDYHYEHQEYGNLISRHDAAETQYYHFDAHGCTNALTDASEVITDDYTYNAWGKQLAGSGSTDNPFRWVGQKGYQSDPTTGRIVLGGRELDPNSGRFLSEDPLGFEGGDTNLFRYVKNNAPNKIDPSGQGEGAEIQLQAATTWLSEVQICRSKKPVLEGLMPSRAQYAIHYWIHHLPQDKYDELLAKAEQDVKAKLDRYLTQYVERNNPLRSSAKKTYIGPISKEQSYRNISIDNLRMVINDKYEMDAVRIMALERLYELQGRTAENVLLHWEVFQHAILASGAGGGSVRIPIYDTITGRPLFSIGSNVSAGGPRPARIGEFRVVPNSRNFRRIPTISPNAMTSPHLGANELEDQFGHRFEELNNLADKVMDRVGVPKRLRGIIESGNFAEETSGRPFTFATAQGGRNTLPGRNLRLESMGRLRIVKAGLYVDGAVLDNNLIDSKSWRNATIEQRMEAVVAHELAELRSGGKDMGWRHGHALWLSYKNPNISAQAKRIIADQIRIAIEGRDSAILSSDERSDIESMLKGFGNREGIVYP